MVSVFGLVFPNSCCVTVTNTKAKNKKFSSVAHINKTGGEIKLKSLKKIIKSESKYLNISTNFIKYLCHQISFLYD